jgi:hypothetical protein
MSRPLGHSAAGRIMSMKNSSDTIGNRIRDLLWLLASKQPQDVYDVYLMLYIQS